LVFTYGLTNFGANNQTSWPSATSLRAQWCALLQASMPIRQQGRVAKKVAISLRFCCLRSTAFPGHQLRGLGTRFLPD
jgi:hypothetical protein